MVKKYNISSPKKYFKDNVEKTLWQNVGTMTEFHKQDGSVSRIIEIPAIGLNANVFPFEDRKEPRDDRQLSAGYNKPKPNLTPEEEYNQITPAKETEEVINPEDIPY